MKFTLSNRLLACCGFVRQGERVADVGCDHGLLGIYLVKSGIASSVIASDIHSAPLQCARENAAKFGVSDRIRFYLSDGAAQIPRDFDAMVCAGMGADTMISILSTAQWLKSSRYRLILQCQSKQPELRKFLAANGFAISQETLARDGKFLYSVMQACYAPGQTPQPWDYYITPQLIAANPPLLLPFVRRVCGSLEDRLMGLRTPGDEKYLQTQEILTHLRELERKLCHGNGE